MNKLNIEAALALSRVLEDVANLVKTTGKAQSVVWIDKLQVAVPMATSEKPEEFGWEILAVVE